MFAVKNFSRASGAVKATAIAALCLIALIYSGECSSGAENAIELCLGTLVPSLFPFMVLAALIMSGGTAHKLGRPFAKVTGLLFGLDGCFAPAIILSMVGGYPVGARAISSLSKSGEADETQCRRAAMFCVCSGPGFAVNYIGGALFKNTRAGFIILGAQCLSVVISGVGLHLISALRGKNDRKIPCPAANAPPHKQSFGDTLVAAVLDASKGMAAICAFVIAFSAFVGALSSRISQSEAKAALLIFAEVCSAANELAGKYPIELTAFAVGFGGICVHFQIFASLGNLKINKILFFFVRIIQGLLTALLTRAGLKIFSVSTQVFSTSAAGAASIYGGTIISGAALIFTAICFILSIKKER